MMMITYDEMKYSIERNEILPYKISNFKGHKIQKETDLLLRSWFQIVVWQQVTLKIVFGFLKILYILKTCHKFFLQMIPFISWAQKS
jgi:hypothetical protein